MLRRLFLSKSWLVIALAVALACWGRPAAAYQLEVTAWIDGYSRLIIQGNTVQWHNIAWSVPGWEPVDADSDPPNFPTTLMTADMGSVDWYPVWNTIDPGTGYPAAWENWSDQFTGLTLAMAAVDQVVGLNLISGRNTAFIFQQPAATNAYTLIVDFDDYYQGGAAWYTVQLDYTPVPLPGAVWLLGSGLLGLVGLHLRPKS